MRPVYFLALACTGITMSVQPLTADGNETTSPNVVVILADDQGWGDLSVNGNTNLVTPVIDQLAADGATLQHFYVCAVCAPTRAEFLTGRYYPRTGVSGVSRGEGRLNANELTIADVFKAAGYATGCFGKWHNGTQPPLHPNNRGFDEYYGFTSGHWGHYFSPPLDHNGQRVRGNGFIADDFTDHAIEFIKEHREQQFFCYLPFNTPHSPMMVPDRFYKKFDGAAPEMTHRDPDKEDVMMTRAALALCENIDWNVGRVMKTLDELQLRDNTIVVYFSDNGPNSWRWNGGMKGRKGSIDEGGLRSPFIIRWPGHIKPGLTISQIAAAIDLLPTLSELAGIPWHKRLPIDGTSIAPLLRETVTEWPDRRLFSTQRGKTSVRTKHYRLDGDGRLFNITTDPGQNVNVAAKHPQITKELTQAAGQHHDEMLACFRSFSDRPFHVGYGAVTTLPARDGIPHGGIKRSSKAPNNSFFANWTNVDDFISWDVQVAETAEFDAIVYYTCPASNTGAIIQLAAETGEMTEAAVDVAFDPALYDKSKERVAKSHYFVKDFRPLKLGRLRLPAGRNTLRLRAATMPGKGLIDVHSIVLKLAQ